MIPRWLAWVREIQAVGQTGLAYSKDPYDIQRYERLRHLAREMMAAAGEVEVSAIDTLFSGEAGHATPKVDVRAAVFQENRLLLVRERSDGLWTLPGGWAEPGESPSEAIVREVKEESGYCVRATRLLAVYDRDKHGHPPHVFHIYKLFFACEFCGGEASVSIETGAIDFFAAEAIPDLSTDRVTPAQISRLFEFHRNPDTPADFD